MLAQSGPLTALIGSPAAHWCAPCPHVCLQMCTDTTTGTVSSGGGGVRCWSPRAARSAACCWLAWFAAGALLPCLMPCTSRCRPQPGNRLQLYTLWTGDGKFYKYLNNGTGGRAWQSTAAQGGMPSGGQSAPCAAVAAPLLHWCGCREGGPRVTAVAWPQAALITRCPLHASRCAGTGPTLFATGIPSSGYCLVRGSYLYSCEPGWH